MLETPVEKCAQLQSEPSRQGFSTGGQSHVRWFKKKKKKKRLQLADRIACLGPRNGGRGTGLVGMRACEASDIWGWLYTVQVPCVVGTGFWNQNRNVFDKT